MIRRRIVSVLWLAAFPFPSLLVAATAAAAATGAPPSAARVVVAVLPPVVEQPADAELALAIQELASAYLVASGRYDDVSVKQTLRMAERERLAPSAFADPMIATLAATRLGAARAVTARLTRTDKAWRLAVVVVDGAQAPVATPPLDLPAAFAQAVVAGGLGMARAAAAAEKLALAEAPPPTLSDEAARALAACDAVLVRQPMGIENPSVLLEADLARAVDACRRAASADPKLTAAWASLGLALAIRGDDRDAVAALAKATPGTTYVPMYWLARYWLVTRYQSNGAGAGVLREAIARHPGFLLARGYLAEHLNAVGAHDEALAAWRDYLAEVPRSPFVLAKVGYTLARLGRYDEALATTKKARERDPESLDVALELASRCIDAGDATRAIELLQPLAARGDARGEVVLRLGYAHLLKGELDRSEPLLRQAVELASRPEEWRTRGRAKLDLAKLMVRRGRVEAAEALVLEAMREGFRPYALDKQDEDLAAIAKNAEATLARERATPASMAPRLARPRETSPFATLGSGEIDAQRIKPPPPAGFEVLRF